MRSQLWMLTVVLNIAKEGTTHFFVIMSPAITVYDHEYGSHQTVTARLGYPRLLPPPLEHQGLMARSNKSLTCLKAGITALLGNQ